MNLKRAVAIFTETFRRAKRIGTPEDEAIEKGLKAVLEATKQAEKRDEKKHNKR